LADGSVSSSSLSAGTLPVIGSSVLVLLAVVLAFLARRRRSRQKAWAKDPWFIPSNDVVVSTNELLGRGVEGEVWVAALAGIGR
jgi:MYXO-CTERM domain-containing protein